MSRSKNTVEMTVDEIVENFKSISRQAIKAKIARFKYSDDVETYKKLTEAMEIFMGFKNAGTDRVYGKCVGKGVYERGEYSHKTNKKESSIWYMMINRCYSKLAKHKSPSYQGCTMSELFLNFQNFVTWAKVQKGAFVDGFELDKDLLIKGNRLYSEDRCVFIPKEINIVISEKLKIKPDGLPTGVRLTPSQRYVARCKLDGKDNYIGTYTTKEEAASAYNTFRKDKITKLAEKWKDQIDPRAYQALLDFEV